MSSSTLDTGIKLVKHVGTFTFGAGSLADLPAAVAARRGRAGSAGSDARVLYVVDQFFADRSDVMSRLGAEESDRIDFVPTLHEPTTDDIDRRVAAIVDAGYGRPATIVAVGGGITMDTAKAIANLLTNGGRAEQYQGWDLVKV